MADHATDDNEYREVLREVLAALRQQVAERGIILDVWFSPRPDEPFHWFDQQPLWQALQRAEALLNDDTGHSPS